MADWVRFSDKHVVGGSFAVFFGLSLTGATGSAQASAESKSEIRIDKGDGDAAISSSDLSKDAASGTQTTSFKDHLTPPLNKMAADIWTRSDVGKDSLHNSDLQATSINRFSLSYKPDDRHIWIANQEIDVTYGHIGGQTSANMNDIYLGYVDTKAGKIFDWNVTVSGRVYLPNGEQSRFVTLRQGALAALFIQDHSYGRFDLTNVVFAIHHNQIQNAYISPITNTLTSNDDSEIDDYFETAYNLSDKFSTYHVLGIEQVWERAMPTTGIQQLRHLFNEVGFRYKVGVNAMVATSIWNDANLVNPIGRSQFQMFRDDETGFRLYVSAGI